MAYLSFFQDTALRTTMCTIQYRRLDEQTKLAEALQRHLRLQAGQASMQALLQRYVDAGVEHLGILLQQEHRPVSPINFPHLPSSRNLHLYIFGVGPTWAPPGLNAEIFILFLLE